MGDRHTYKKLLRTLKSARFYNIFIFILLLTSVDNVNSKRSCDVDKCGDLYRPISEIQDLTKKCRQLSLHRDCLRRIRNACRGNLLYHTSDHINQMNLGSSNCSDILAEDAVDFDDDYRGNSRAGSNQCVYAGKPKFKFCSLFGDPHVRTFSDKLHTCKANGSWRLVSNDYLVVKATNSLLPGQMQATAISKLVVIIRGSGECAKKKIYRAEIGKVLPHSFDGATHTGPDKSVNITVQEPGKEIRIDVRFIATTIVVRNVGSHLSFSIQMPEDIVDNPVDDTVQMCVSGCHKKQRIHLSHEISRLSGKPEKQNENDRKYTEHEARRMCRDALLEGDDIEILNRRRRSAGRGSRRRRERKNDPNMDASAATFKQLSGLPGEPRLPKGYKSNRRKISSSRKAKTWDTDFLHDDPGVRRYTGSRGGRRDRARGVVSKIGRGTNFYFEACVFDLMTTGDDTYATSARGAYDDVTKYHRSGSKAKGASKKPVASWAAKTTTSPPEQEQLLSTTTKRTREFKDSTPGNRARPISLNASLILVCLLLTTYLSNLTQYSSFCNQRKVT